MSILINGTCKDCFHVQRRPRGTEPIYHCMSVKVSPHSDPAHDGAQPHDDLLEVGPDFGCIHWKARP